MPELGAAKSYAIRLFNYDGAGFDQIAWVVDRLRKAYGNLVELAHLQEHVARELELPVARLVVHAKSAHVYEPEWALMAELARRREPVA